MSEDHVGERRLETLRRLYKAFNRHDASGVMACLAPDVVFDATAGPTRSWYAALVERKLVEWCLRAWSSSRILVGTGRIEAGWANNGWLH